MRCQLYVRLLLLLAASLITLSLETELNLFECGGFRNFSQISYEENGGYSLHVTHPVFDPLIDLIPDIDYTIVISHREHTKDISGLNLTIEEVIGTGRPQNNITGYMYANVDTCNNNGKTLNVSWVLMTPLKTCIILRAYIIEKNTTGYLVTRKLCKTPACRSYIKVDRYGYLTSPGYPDRYPDNNNCTTIIYTTSTKLLHLQDFQIEDAYEDECFDYVVIQFDSTNIKKCGSQSQNGLKHMFYTSYTGAIQLTLVSDNKLVRKGFKVIYFITDENECNVTLNATNGSISSPNYPDIYFPNLFCEYKIILPDTYRIQLNIEYLDLEHTKSEKSHQCANDVLTISSGEEDTTSQNVLKFCNKNIIYSNQSVLYESSASIIYLTFKTNHLIEGFGFYIKYESFLSCKNQSYFADSGVFTSINFPFNYLNNQECFYDIHLLKDSSTIEILFSIFYTESDADVFSKGAKCDQDYLEIFKTDGSTKICGSWDKTNTPLIFRSKNRSVILKFVSNGIITKPGFYARWRAIEDNLTHIYCDPTWIEMDDYSFEIVREFRSWLDSSEDCKSKGAVLAVIPDIETQKIIETGLHASVNCSLNIDAFWIGANDVEYESDFFWINGRKMEFKYWFPGWKEYKYANKQPSDDGLSQEDCVEMRQTFNFPSKGQGRTKEYFWNDRNCEVRNSYICQHFKQGVTMPSPPGSVECNETIIMEENDTISISSPRYPDNYPDLVDCNIIIVYPVGTHAEINFGDFHLENDSSCAYDNVTLCSYPGDTNMITRCGNWNGRQKLLRWISTTNYIFLRFRSDHSVTQSGFLAHISASHEYICADVNATISKDVIDIYSGPGNCYIPFFDELSSYNRSNDVCLDMGANLIDVDLYNEFWFSNFLYKLQGGYEVSLWAAGRPTKNDSGTYCNAYVFVLKNGPDYTEPAYNKLLTTVPCEKELTFVCDIHQDIDSIDNQVYVDVYMVPSGIISPLLDVNGVYMNNCNHKYILRTPLNHRIFLKLEMLDIEYQENCIYDYLKIVGLIDDVTYCGQLSGNETPIYLLSKGNKVAVSFHSDFSVSSAGFRFSWSWINADSCMQYSFSDDNQYLQSLNYPLPYMDVLNCCKNISTQKGYRIIFRLEELNFHQNHILDVDLRIRYGENKEFDVFNSPDILEIYEPVISEDNYIEVCFATQSIDVNEGFRALYTFVQANYTTLEYNINFRDDVNKTGIIHNLHYPESAAVNTSQIIRFNAPIGYNVVLTFDEFEISGKQDTSDTFMELLDDSFGNTNIYNLKNWTSFTRPGDGDFPVVIQSRFNKLVLRFVSGKNNGRKIYAVNYNLMIDPDYLIKTREFINGSIDSCNQNTCLNNGSCNMVLDDRYICGCGRHFTGFFCQVSWCELNPCVHGSCELSDDRYNCTCEADYWGPECNLTKQQCDQIYCKGKGVCSAANNWIPTCSCFTGWTGETCSRKITGTTVGSSKPLGEPIWIGLIVILALLFGFGALFAVKRRCGRHFKCCDGTKQMIRKREAKQQPNPATVTPLSPNDISNKPTNFPSLAIVVEEIKHKHDREKASKESSPTATTPTIDSKNERAAARLYASFRSNSSTYPSVQQNKATLDPNVAINVGGLVGGTLAFTDIESENSTSEKIDDRFVLRSPPNSSDYKRKRRLGLSQYKSQSENNSVSSGQQFDINENDYVPKSHSLEAPSFNYYPDIVIINDEIRPVHKIDNANEAEMIEMSTLSVPDPMQFGDSEEDNENEVSFTNLDASSKRRIFASKARSDCGVMNGDHIHKLIDTRRNYSSPDGLPFSMSEFDSSEEILPLSFETDYGILIPKRQLDLQRSAMSYDEMLMQKYFHEEELRRQRRRQNSNARSAASLNDFEHLHSAAYSRREDHFHRRHRHHRSRHKNKYYVSINRRPSKLVSADSDHRSKHRSRSSSFNSGRYTKQNSSSEPTKTVDQPLRKSNRHKNPIEENNESKYHKQRTNSRAFTKRRPVEFTDSSSGKDDSLKRPIRKSRSNDLNLNSFSLLQTRDLKLMSEPDLLHRSQSKRRRRHSFHSPKTPLKIHPHPDDMLDQQNENLETMEESFESASMLDERKETNSNEINNVAPIKALDTGNPSMLSVTDTDTGFDSTSKSIYSSPRREVKDETNYIYRTELRVKDSAYQTNQSSIDRFTVDSVPIIDHLPDKRLQNGKRADDKKVYNQLEMAARKLAIFQSSVYKNRISKDSAVNIVSEDELNTEDSDNSSREHPPLRRTSISGLFPLFPLEQVSEEGDVYTPENISIPAHDHDSTVFLDHTPTNGEEFSEFPA